MQFVRHDAQDNRQRGKQKNDGGNPQCTIDFHKFLPVGRIFWEEDD